MAPRAQVVHDPVFIEKVMEVKIECLELLCGFLSGYQEGSERPEEEKWSRTVLVVFECLFALRFDPL